MKTVEFCCRQEAPRFWSKVRRGVASECWPWLGNANSWGYGDCIYGNRRSNASRVAYIMANGEIPRGLVVCHSCDNRLCCNPAHLWTGSPGDNVRDCVAKGRNRVRTGVDHHRAGAKLSLDMVRAARTMHFKDGLSQSEIARRFGVHSSTISRAVRGEYWPHA